MYKHNFCFKVIAANLGADFVVSSNSMGPIPYLQADEVKLTADFKFPNKVDEEAKEGEKDGRGSALSPEEGEFELQ